MKVARMPTPLELDRLLRRINYAHMAFAAVFLILSAWSFVSGTNDNMRVGAIFALSMFVGLYFYTNSVRRTLFTPPEHPEKQE